MADGAMKVLLAIDGSEPAGLALGLVADIAWPAGTEIVVTEVVETGAGLFGGPWPALAMVQVDQIEADLSEHAHRVVDQARDRLEQPGLDVKAVVLRGRPATAIADRARAMAADLVVVGSRGHGTIESLLLGSVSAEVVDLARGTGARRPRPPDRADRARLGRFEPARRGPRISSAPGPSLLALACAW